MKYGTTHAVLKPLSEVLLPDPRFEVWAIESEKRARPFALADMHGRLSETTLDSGVPADVRLQFETARNLMLYAWFVFEFQTMAELQAYAALELALRTRFPDSRSARTKKGRSRVSTPGIRPLLKKAVEEKFISAEKLPAWERVQSLRAWREKQYGPFTGKPLSVSEWQAALLDAIPDLRNHLAHGNPQLDLFGSLRQMELCADLINALFVPQTLHIASSTTSRPAARSISSGAGSR